ncbi:MAG: NAD-dependent epimerase/dehydratase family protein [Betaproteobacteria bacterium]|nr:NAD-dependent epimerase/dehydratase family protein [Betaproteobacteria bacterium]
MTRVLITGGGGFIGARLARHLLAHPPAAWGTAPSLTLTDQFPLPADLASDPRVTAVIGPLGDQGALFSSGFDKVFHLASAVSGECELDFELGLRSNLDGTRTLLEGLRQAGNQPCLVFSSSIAVYGPDPGLAMPAVVDENTLAAPQTSYGAQKLMCEYLIADYTRKGYVDGRSARLMTVSVRPGQPNGAASSFFSGIIREPLAGVQAVCPVDPDVAHPLASPQSTVLSLVGLMTASRDTLKRRLAIALPAVNVTVAQMLDALERVAGPEVRARVTFKRDERIAAIVANWPRAAKSDTATALLGFPGDVSFDAIIQQYIDDMRATGQADTALKGLSS